MIVKHDLTPSYDAYRVYFFSAEGNFIHNLLVDANEMVEEIEALGFAKHFKIDSVPDFEQDVEETVRIIDSKNGKLYSGFESVDIKEAVTEFSEMKSRFESYLK